MPAPDSYIDVVAAAITDSRGHYLLSRRQETSDLPGLWEFPGGKREAGESAEVALQRELQEELGITAQIGDTIIVVPQIYAHKQIRLEVRHVVAWQGNLHGREGQALMWVDPHKFSRYSLPSADIPAVSALVDPEQLFLASFLAECREHWIDQLNDILDHCPSRIILQPSAQLALSDWNQLLCEGFRMRRRSRSKAQCLIAAQLELAKALNLGVYLSEDQLLASVKRPLPPHQLVGVKCRTLGGLRHAERLGCDFAVVGNTQASPSSRADIDWGQFEQLRARVSLPIYVADRANKHLDLSELRRHGAQGPIRAYACAMSYGSSA